MPVILVPVLWAGGALILLGGGWYVIGHMSSDEKARSDSVRMLPSAPRLKLSAVAESSSGASTTVTMSYRPCVQNISFTVTPNVLAICLKASARFGESLAFLTP